MTPRWLWRMSRWARNPPSEKRVRLVLAVVALCLALYAIEYFFGTPDWIKNFGARPRFRP